MRQIYTTIAMQIVTSEANLQGIFIYQIHY